MGNVARLMFFSIGKWLTVFISFRTDHANTVPMISIPKTNPLMRRVGKNRKENFPRCYEQKTCLLGGKFVAPQWFSSVRIDTKWNNWNHFSYSCNCCFKFLFEFQLVNVQCNISFRCTIEWFNTSIHHSVLITTVALHPHLSFSPSPTKLLSGNHQFVLSS